MKDIKYRAWLKEHNKMQDVSSIDCGTGRILAYGYTKQILPEKYVLMQSTGQKDKNDVKIYEGDIVKFTLLFGDNEYIGLVIYENGQYIVDCSGKKISIADTLGLGVSEVVGNIHQNPELLKEGRK